MWITFEDCFYSFSIKNATVRPARTITTTIETLKIIPRWIILLAEGLRPNASTPLAAVRPNVMKARTKEANTTAAATRYFQIGLGALLVGRNANFKRSV